MATARPLTTPRCPASCSCQLCEDASACEEAARVAREAMERGKRERARAAILDAQAWEEMGI
jgi:hypothetical protein